MKPEVLAPAGHPESFMAAIEAGADALYLGIKRFNLRDRTGNFTFKELERLIPHAQSRGVKVYPVFNSILKEGELAGAMKALAILSEMAPDALIVADWGLIMLIRRHFPNLVLHGSTQLSIHNRAGLEFCRRQGLARVILARELSFEEIRALAKDSPVEIETFVHGALCYAYSGACLISSYHGGRSANRGMCAQSCRRVYQWEDGGRQRRGTVFSASDLNTLPFIPAYAAAGIHSLKIEGRQRSAEYVFKAVSAYRKVLDATPTGFAVALAEAQQIVAGDLGRAHTGGHVASASGAGVVISGLAANAGRLIGPVLKVANGHVVVESRERLHIGDRLRLYSHRDAEVRNFRLGPYDATPMRLADGPGHRYRIPCKVEAAKGDYLYKTGSAVFEPQLRRYREEFSRIVESNEKPGVDLRIHLARDSIRLEIAPNQGQPFSRLWPVEILESDKPLDDDILLGYLARSGDTPVRIAHVEVSRDADVPGTGFIPPKTLKRMRREFFASAIPPDADTIRTYPVVDGYKREFLQQHAKPRSVSTPGWSLRLPFMHTEAEWQRMSALYAPPFDELVVPLNAPMAEMLQDGGAVPPDHRYLLPRVVNPTDWPDWVQQLQRFYAMGARRFMLGNLAQHEIFHTLPGCSLALDIGFNLLNSAQLAFWHSLGVERAALSPECDRRLMASLLSVPNPIEVEAVVYASPPVFFARMPAGDGCGDARPMEVRNDRGDRFTVQREEGFTYVRSCRPMSLLAFADDLAAMGVSRLRIDLEPHECSAAFLGRLMATPADRRPLAGATSFNYEHGVR